MREYEKDGKPRTAIIQRCIRIKPPRDAPPPAKKPKITATTPKISRPSQPTVEIPIPASSASMSKQSTNKDLPAAEHSLPSAGPPSLVSSALPLVTAAGGLLSKVFGYAAPVPTISASVTGPPFKPTMPTQKKGRKGGRPSGNTAAEILARKNPVVEIVSPSHTSSSTTLVETTVVSSTGMHSDTSVLGKRKRTEKNYYIQSIAEIEAAEAAAMEANLSANGSVNGNGRAVRSTRNPKSMRESPPPPLRGPSGPMYTGPFIHRKRCATTRYLRYGKAA